MSDYGHTFYRGELQVTGVDVSPPDKSQWGFERIVDVKCVCSGPIPQTFGRRRDCAPSYSLVLREPQREVEE